MKLITERSLIKDICDHWKEQYGRSIAKGKDDKYNIYCKLCALDTDIATKEDIADIIGNDSWVKVHCDECNKNVATVVVLGEEYDYDSKTAYICPNCLKKALKLL